VTTEFTDLVHRARAGDTLARDAIAEEFRERIHRYITTMIGDPDITDDLTQETFSKGFAKLDDLRNPERLGPWLYTIAVNLCRQHLKRQVDKTNPDNSRSLDTDPMGARRSVLSNVVLAESAQALALAIDRLPILLREALVLHIVEGLPYPDIAEITGATVEALHVRAHRAKALLRKQLGTVVDTFWVERT
jgi:RNA polymerase sigma-70 factor, ECF subfamily